MGMIFIVDMISECMLLCRLRNMVDTQDLGVFRYFHIYVDSDHFLGFEILNFNIFFFFFFFFRKMNMFWG